MTIIDYKLAYFAYRDHTSAMRNKQDRIVYAMRDQIDLLKEQNIDLRKHVDRYEAMVRDIRSAFKNARI